MNDDDKERPYKGIKSMTPLETKNHKNKIMLNYINQ